jgi:hypothetical protein
MARAKFTNEEFREIVGRWESSAQRERAGGDLDNSYSADEVSTALRELGATEDEVREVVRDFVSEVPGAIQSEAAPIRPTTAVAEAPGTSAPLPVRLVAKALVLAPSVMVFACSFATKIVLAGAETETAATSPALLHALVGVDHILGPWIRGVALVGIVVGGAVMMFSEG